MISHFYGVEESDFTKKLMRWSRIHQYCVSTISHKHEINAK